jgi:hypothetical protein
LKETIVNLSQTNPDGSHPTYNRSYTVNIPVTVRGDTAYVGFSGATGGLNAIVDITTWTYTEGDETTLAPRAPGNVRVTSFAVTGYVD